MIPIIETGKGMANIRAITAAGTRVKRIAFGAGDFTLDMDMEWTRAEAELLPYRSECVLASRAAGIEAAARHRVGGPEGPPRASKASTRHIKGLGFQGKMCIHPDQVPRRQRRSHSLRGGGGVVAQGRAGLREAEKAGSASIQLDGKFIDYPIVYRAQRVLETMQRIRERGKHQQGR